MSRLRREPWKTSPQRAASLRQGDCESLTVVTNNAADPLDQLFAHVRIVRMVARVAVIRRRRSAGLVAAACLAVAYAHQRARSLSVSNPASCQMANPTA